MSTPRALPSTPSAATGSMVGTIDWSTRCHAVDDGGVRFAVMSIALVAMLIAAPAIAATAGTDRVPDVAVKAALVYNFARFVEWPALSAGAHIVICVVGNDEMAVALVEAVRGQNISGHGLDVARPQDSARWPVCQLLFIAGGETRRAESGLDALKTLPILTVSDAKGFCRSDGMVELYVEDGRMRFAINMDAADRSGLRLSSRLLGLAKVIRDGHHDP